jgi:hypothetical protein
MKCKCGCGRETKIATRTYTRNGYKKGEPQNFFGSHHKPKHGMQHTPEYNSYCNAKQRCDNPTNKDYEFYGGRGIKFLFKTFEEFFAELGYKPEPKRAYSVDRKNNSRHYEVGNVKWSTAKQQNNNRRKRSR